MATRKTGASKAPKAPKASTPPATAESKSDDQLTLDGDGGGEVEATDQASGDDATAGGDASAAPVEAPAANPPAETKDAADDGADQADQDTDSEPDAPAPVAFAGGVGRYCVLKPHDKLPAVGTEFRMANARAAGGVAEGFLVRI